MAAIAASSSGQLTVPQATGYSGTSPSASPFNSPTLGRLKGYFTKGFGGGNKSSNLNNNKEQQREKLQEDGAPELISPRFNQVSLRQVDYFGMLPDEILVHLLTFLSPRDVVNAVALLDPRFCRLANDDALWRVKFTERWDRMPSPKMRSRGWKSAFILQTRADKDWLNPKRKPRSQLYSGHSNIIRTVDFDDTKIVSGGEDKTIIVWNRETRKQEKVIQEHTGIVHTLQFTDKLLVSGGGDNVIKLFDIADDYKCQATIQAHSKGVRCIQIDQNLLFSGAYDHTVKMWDVETQALVKEFKRDDGTLPLLNAHDKTVFGIQYRRADNLLITTGADRHIRAFDPRVDKETWHIGCTQLHTDWIMTLCCDDQNIVVGSRDKTISVWDIRTQRFSHTLQGHRLGVVDLQMDDQKIVSGSGDNTARVWDRAKHYCVRSIEHADTVWCVRFKEDALVTGGGKGDSYVRLYSFT